jgi:hypothetical protein
MGENRIRLTLDVDVNMNDLMTFLVGSNAVITASVDTLDLCYGQNRPIDRKRAAESIFEQLVVAFPPRVRYL